VSDTAIGLLAELVAARSPNPPGDERAVAAVVERAASALGLPDPLRLAPRPQRPNLIFELGRGRPRILLAAHMDTMPPGDLAAWGSDPWTLHDAGGRLTGLGVADMKASIAAMLHAGARIAGRRPSRGTLVLAFTADEESGSADGMAWLCREGAIDADAAIMTEPSSVGAGPWEALFVGQRGSCVLELVAHGRPGHSGESVPARDRAGWALGEALHALHRSKPFAGVAHSADGTGPTVNVATMVSGGEVPFAHPAQLRATVEVRTLPGQTPDGVRSALEQVLAAAGLAERTTLVPASPTSWIPAGETVADQPLLDAARAAWREVHGLEPRTAVLPAGTDSSHVDALGIPALPAFGPGSLAVAHRPDENLGASEVSTAIDLFEAVVRRYLEAS